MIGHYSLNQSLLPGILITCMFGMNEFSLFVNDVTFIS